MSNKRRLIKPQRGLLGPNGNPRKKMPSVSIGFCHPSIVSAFWAESMISLVGFSAPIINGIISVWSGPKVDEARNDIFRIWLDTKETDYLFMVDTDMNFPNDALLRLIQHDKDIVGGLCFTSDHLLSKVTPTIAILVPQEGGGNSLQPLWDYPEDSLVPCDATGGAFILVKREVAVKMREARGKDHAMPWFAHGMHGNTRIGEDIGFCLSARALGFEVWVDTGLVIGHVKPQIVGPPEYAISLSRSIHPAYNDRDEIPVYQRLVNGHNSSDGDKPVPVAFPA